MKRKKKIGRVVPTLVLSASFASVVPACGGQTSSTDAGGNDANDNDVSYGVGVAYCCFDGGVADVAFNPDALYTTDAPTDAPEGG